MTVSTASREASVSSSGNQTKKKRNLPGMPDPDAEVIALSPNTLMATNRFVCEICNKGFQRDQNLQLHRRGHNLPWKLRQRSSKEVRKRVYVCPELSCVHHDPSRALGDLTGIKKHFCRKHGEKKWNCDKCSKKYAVQSDWKAHLKTCGSKEYKCDCGTLRDSFITHRGFCDALAEESARAQTVASSNSEGDPKLQIVASSPPPPPSTTVIPAALPSQNPGNTELPENSTGILQQTPVDKYLNGSSSSSSSSRSVFAGLFASSTAAGSLKPTSTCAFSDLICGPTNLESTSATELTSLCLSNQGQGLSVFATAGQERRQYAPAMSATALLQKAAEMGAAGAGTNASLLRGLGITVLSSWSGQEEESLQWKRRIDNDRETAPISARQLGLEIPSDGGAGLMIRPTSLIGSKPTTLDLLGIGAPTGELSALITSISGGNGKEHLRERPALL
ncbi:hypothetical protein HHK36_031337 [Tetracentron sinense]|uniref:C2H2-type domain-containing protein n=1 Tax=Tetracentron sinense TaxID=13715 RepID=A0A834Y978_TETSI|nr:hypothetical protein HHK36_031337 [Tetracentron sinense]